MLWHIQFNKAIHSKLHFDQILLYFRAKILNSNEHKKYKKFLVMICRKLFEFEGLFGNLIEQEKKCFIHFALRRIYQTRKNLNYASSRSGKWSKKTFSWKYLFTLGPQSHVYIIIVKKMIFKFIIFKIWHAFSIISIVF